jgi:hypothetical protein
MARLTDYDLKMKIAQVLELIYKDGFKLLKDLKAAKIAREDRLTKILKKLEDDGKIEQDTRIMGGRALRGYRRKSQPSIPIDGKTEQDNKIMERRVLCGYKRKSQPSIHIKRDCHKLWLTPRQLSALGIGFKFSGHHIIIDSDGCSQ